MIHTYIHSLICLCIFLFDYFCLSIRLYMNHLFYYQFILLIYLFIYNQYVVRLFAVRILQNRTYSKMHKMENTNDIGRNHSYWIT